MSDDSRPGSLYASASPRLRDAIDDALGDLERTKVKVLWLGVRERRRRRQRLMRIAEALVSALGAEMETTS